MMILYRRHKAGCAGCRCRKEKKRECHCCRCPIWAGGYFEGSRIRKSLDTGDWSKAQRSALNMEAQLTEPKKSEEAQEPTTIAKTQEMYLADAVKRGLRKATIDRHRIIFKQLQAFIEARGLKYLNQLTTERLTEFRSGWKGSSPLADVKKLERLKSFFRFCVERGWLAENPAKALRNPKVSIHPTLPFTEAEMLAIRTAALNRIDAVRADGRHGARRLHAFILFLRYTGLRISDAVGCPADRLQNGKVWLYTQKTGQHVYCPLPGFVARELDSIPKMSERYWFWSGQGTLETARKEWSEKLARLFEDAKVDGHAHQFRDTFAVELLQAEVPIERVSVLLGHASVRITEKHYNPWNRARQEQAEADVQRAWQRDPMVLFEEKFPQDGHVLGTRQ